MMHDHSSHAPHSPHSHTHGHGDEDRAIGMAFWLNFTFTIIEFVGGLMVNSVAILSDAVHDLGDTHRRTSDSAMATSGCQCWLRCSMRWC